MSITDRIKSLKKGSRQVTIEFPSSKPEYKLTVSRMSQMELRQIGTKCIVNGEVLALRFNEEVFKQLVTKHLVSFDVLGDLTVNGKSVFIQDVGTDSGLAVEVQGRMKILEKELAGYIASASIQIGGTKDSIDCGGFF